jgi:hypothetical protein
VESDYVVYLSFIKHTEYGEMFQLKLGVLLFGTDMIMILFL